MVKANQDIISQYVLTEIAASKHLKRLRRPWQNLESSQHLLHHAKDYEGDDSGERAVARG